MIRSQRLTPVASQENTLQTWRERILTMFLRILLIFGTPALIVNILPAIETKQFTLIAIYVLAFLLVLWLNFARQYPYSIRAGGMLLIAYIFSAIILIAFGLAGDGRIWMLFFVVFTTPA
ncbi:MAG: hypothetical protein OEZ02_15060 [Anaerolineae bacterium]|nr:hypothetical protein [Anaerolineae bacterium]